MRMHIITLAAVLALAMPAAAGELDQEFKGGDIKTPLTALKAPRDSVSDILGSELDDETPTMAHWRRGGYGYGRGYGYGYGRGYGYGYGRGYGWGGGYRYAGYGYGYRSYYRPYYGYGYGGYGSYYRPYYGSYYYPSYSYAYYPSYAYSYYPSYGYYGGWGHCY